MAESVRVITEEWNDIQTKIKGKVDDIEMTLDEFKDILNDLVTNGFIESGAQEPMISFMGNVDDIKQCLNYIHQNISNVVKEYIIEIETKDHNNIQ